MVRVDGTGAPSPWNRDDPVRTGEGGRLNNDLVPRLSRPENSWSSRVDTVERTLKAAKAVNRIAVFLKVMCDVFGWDVAENWVLKGGAYRISHEVHADSPPLHRFARESATIAVPEAWVRPDRWRLDAAAQGTIARQVFWSQFSTLSKQSLRTRMIVEVGLKTQIALPVPNRGYLQQMVMLFATTRRDANVEEMNALATAVYLLASTTKPASREQNVSSETQVLQTRIDPRTRRVVGLRGEVRLTVNEWDLLSLLLDREGQAVAFADLAHEVWRAPEAYVGRAVVYEIVARLRRHLLQVGGDCRIASVPRFGYALERVVS